MELKVSSIKTIRARIKRNANPLHGVESVRKGELREAVDLELESITWS